MSEVDLKALAEAMQYESDVAWATFRMTGRALLEADQIWWCVDGNCDENDPRPWPDEPEWNEKHAECGFGVWVPVKGDTHG